MVTAARRRRQQRLVSHRTAPRGSATGRWGSLPPDACTSALRGLADHHRPARADRVALAENRLSRRQGSCGQLRSRFAAVRVRPAGTGAAAALDAERCLASHNTAQAEPETAAVPA
ncbi:hypothetical protein GCM10010360_26710 [Streptomyces nogalater]